MPAPTPETEAPADRPADSSVDVVQSLVRGLEVIRTFDAEHRELSLSDVARRTGISPAAAGRFLRTLESLGYVRTDGRLYALTPRVLELGYPYLSALTVPEVVQPHLEQLSAVLGESASAAVRDGADIVYVGRSAARRIMSVHISIGTRFPVAATSMGRVLLACGANAEFGGVAAEDEAAQLRKLDVLLAPVPRTPRSITEAGVLREELLRVRDAGCAVVDEELELGLRSVAVPVCDRSGAVVAAINVSTSTSRASVADLRRVILPELQRTAAAIEKELHLL